MSKSMKQLTQFAACAVAALSIVACSSEDTAQQDNAKQNTTKGVATFDGSQPSNDTRALTRTTATYTLGGDAKVFWTSSDKIFVQDDANTFHQSNAANLYNPSNKAKAIFSLASGSFTLNNREVRYTGENGTDANTVTIASTQTQTTANDFSHLGTSGDCGTATATGSNGNYTFTLNHKASYLCFVPRCMNTDLGPNIKLTKIKVTADQPIAGKYDFSTGSLAQKAGEIYLNTVTLNTSDFSLNTTTSSLATNGAYMVVAPGTYNFTITYTIKDPATNVECDIVKTIASYNCQVGKINDITAWIDKDMKDYSKQYYMWDAVDYYWKGHEEDAPRVKGAMPAALTYAQNSSDSRWYNTVSFPAQATRTSNALPNANEITWYAKYGDMHWDISMFWSLNGHLYRGGVWVKTKAKLISEGHYSTSINANGDADLRTYNNFYNIAYPHNGNGRPANYETDYFFWPATSYYTSASQGTKGILFAPGEHCYMWTSTAAPITSPLYGRPGAYYLDFQTGDHLSHVQVGPRDFGFPNDPSIFR